MLSDEFMQAVEQLREQIREQIKPQVLFEGTTHKYMINSFDTGEYILAVNYLPDLEGDGHVKVVVHVLWPLFWDQTRKHYNKDQLRLAFGEATAEKPLDNQEILLDYHVGDPKEGVIYTCCIRWRDIRSTWEELMQGVEVPNDLYEAVCMMYEKVGDP